MHIVVTRLCIGFQEKTWEIKTEMGRYTVIFQTGKNGISKTDSVSAFKKTSKTEFLKLSVPLMTVLSTESFSQLLCALARELNCTNLNQQMPQNGF